MFHTPADAYDRFMGRYSSLVACALMDFAGVRAGAMALDVGCGPRVLSPPPSPTLGWEPERVLCGGPVRAVR